MGWSLLVALVLLGAATIFFFRRRRQRRLTLVQHTVRCPVSDCAAVLTIQTDPAACPSRRNIDVLACSLLPPTSFVPEGRKAYFSDVTPPGSYLDESCPTGEVVCAKSCLYALNAAAGGPRPDLVECTSGDALELARLTQSPRILRVMWTQGA